MDTFLKYAINENMIFLLSSGDWAQLQAVDMKCQYLDHYITVSRLTLSKRIASF